MVRVLMASILAHDDLVGKPARAISSPVTQIARHRNANRAIPKRIRDEPVVGYPHRSQPIRGSFLERSISMEALTLAHSYFDAWNRHDAASIAAAFARDGIYSDPTTGGPLSTAAVAGYAAGLWSAFPDLSFEIVSAGQTGDGVVAAQWVMRGTNHGPVLGLPPTGKRIELPGADFIRVCDGAIRSVEGYFDSKLFVEQLGLQAVVQPYTLGPYTFGTAVSVKTGKPTRPGAFSITSLHVRSEQEVDYVRDTSRQIALEMLEMPGFISWAGLRLGDMMMTITAWEQAEDISLLRRSANHKAAMKQFFDPGIASSVMTSVWLPDRISTMVRCSSCDRIARHDPANDRCDCGARLPAPLAYW